MLGGDSGDIRYAHHEMPSLAVLYYGIWVLCLTSLVSNEFIVSVVFGDCFSLTHAHKHKLSRNALSPINVSLAIIITLFICLLLPLDLLAYLLEGLS